MNIKVDIRGLGGLAEDFARLKRGSQKRVLRQATMAGARVGRDALKGTAPVDEGDIRDNLVAASAKQNEPGTHTAGVRIRNVKRTYTNNAANRRAGRAGGSYELPGPAYYWRFGELGTSKEPARPWIRPTWDSNEQEIADAVRDRLGTAIDEALGRR